jgi:hypothetical protein
VDISSASIPAVSFVISAIYAGVLPSKKGNEAIDPARSFGFADCCGQTPDQRRAQFIPEHYCN